MTKKRNATPHQCALDLQVRPKLYVLPQKYATVFDLVWIPGNRRERDMERDIWFWMTPEAARDHAREHLGLEAEIHPLAYTAQLRMSSNAKAFYYDDEWPQWPT